MSSKTVFGLIGVTFLVMCVLYIYMTGIIGGAIAAALVMLIVGFFFATVSGYLVGVIGSSNNPISGLTLSTLVIAALLMVSLGVSGTSGVVAVLARGRGGLRVVARWRANCCRISRSATFWAARRAPFRSRS